MHDPHLDSLEPTPFRVLFPLALRQALGPAHDRTTGPTWTEGGRAQLSTSKSFKDGGRLAVLGIGQSAGRCPGCRRFLVSCPKALVCSCVRGPTTSDTRSWRSAATAVWSHRAPALSVSWAWQRCGFFSRSAMAPHMPRHGESHGARVGHAPAPHGDRPSGGGGHRIFGACAQAGRGTAPPPFAPMITNVVSLGHRHLGLINAVPRARSSSSPQVRQRRSRMPLVTVERTLHTTRRFFQSL